MNYHYYSKEKPQILHKLVQNEFFSPLIEYLAKNKEKRVILRELKQQFPQKKFEHYLEQLIENGLIIRHERQYELGFPIFDKAYQEESKKAADVLFQQLQSVSLLMQQYLMAEEIWKWCFTSHDYFYSQTEEGRYEKYEVGNEKYRFISNDRPHAISLAVYFDFQRQQKNLPKRYHRLEQLIGDVDEEYYFNQVEVIIEKVLAGKYKKRRPSIFHDSLIEAGVIKQQEETYTLLYPLLQEQETRVNFPSLTGTLNQQAFIKNQIYKQLITKISDKGFCYIKKMRL